MNALLGKRIAILGAGNIGRIVLERLTTSGIPAADIVICDSDPARAEEASRRFGPRACSLAEEPLPRSDVFLLTAPPKATLDILRALAPNLRQGQIVVSFAAAVSMSRLEAVVPSGVAVARVMLGTASLVLESGLSIDEIKSLTPMETLDEDAFRQTFADAARAAKEKTDRLEQKLANMS